MRSLNSDGHVRIRGAPESASLAACLRAAEAVGLEAVGITFPPEERADIKERGASAACGASGNAGPLGVRLVQIVDAAITSVGGALDPGPAEPAPDAIVRAVLCGRCPGVDLDPPARRSRYLANLFECYQQVVRSGVARVLGSPLTLGRFPASVTPAELPADELAALARAMFERSVAFELLATAHFSYPYMPVGQFVTEYAQVMTVFARAGVAFLAGSGAQDAASVGNLRFCRRLMAAAGIELSQMVDLRRLPSRCGLEP